MNDKIIIKGAKENNLKNIDLEIPKNKLVVITGVSGSGKSSIAFDTIYAEGKRRYLESLSSYARQFLGGNEKPNVDSIEGLCPSIAIDQKTTNHNPRSTVGTVTEIYDYLRVLFARVGIPYCPNGHGIIQTQTIAQITNKIINSDDGSKCMILAPIIKHQKGTFADLINRLRKEGYLRVIIDDKLYSLDEPIELVKNNFHNIDVVIDRIIIHNDSNTRSRIFDSIESALKLSNSHVNVIINEKMHSFSTTHACNECGFSVSELEPRLFSFNSPIGACNECKGLGFSYEPDEAKMIPDPTLSISEGGIDFFKNTVNTDSLDWQRFDTLLNFYKIDKNIPIKNIPTKQMEYLLYGSDCEIPVKLVSSTGKKYEKIDYIDGILELVKRRHLETSSEAAREYYHKYMSEKPCLSCSGNRLNKAALCIKIDDKNISDLTNLDINELFNFISNLKLSSNQALIATQVIKEITDRLFFLINVGLDYLSLSRSANTLSGGESQRIRLATQIGSRLTGVLYVLDEPSIGLHQKDNDRLIDTLKSIRDLGNSVLVVEHDEDTMNAADYLIDIGPNAGVNGGYVIAYGSPEEVKNNPNSLTGQYLSKTKNILVPKHRRKGNGKKIFLKGAKGNNLKNVDLTINLNQFIAVTGVSGSGKSTLILDTLVKALINKNFNPFVVPSPYKDITGSNHIDKIVEVTQDPIGRTPRSNPATYVGVFDDIRALFSSVPEAKAKGYQKGRFSFNIKGGRCEKCQGDGILKIDMQFLPSVYITCDECDGKRYNEETLSIKYKSKSIYDILSMSIDESVEFFKNIPSIHKKLSLMQEVGLGYLTLGANSTHLSGGEAQRIKLAKFLQKKPTGKTIFVLDEPTTGLHIDDVSKLINILNKIVDNGDTVIVIEHNLDLIKVADHIIDLGPDGGIRGGMIVGTGTPEQLISNSKSYTGQYLKKYL